MQDELTAGGFTVTILGVNEVGHESGNPSVCAGRDIPWLQETAEELVWSTWGIAYRDVIVVDGNGEVVAVFNLTQNDLGNATNYAALKAIFESEASSP